MCSPVTRKAAFGQTWYVGQRSWTTAAWYKELMAWRADVRKCKAKRGCRSEGNVSAWSEIPESSPLVAVASDWGESAQGLPPEPHGPAWGAKAAGPIVCSPRRHHKWKQIEEWYK